MRLRPSNSTTPLAVLLFLTLLGSAAWAQNWQGTWKTDFGELRLYDLGQYVVGDYGGKGLIVGSKEFDLLQGVFTNPGAKKSGYFTFQSQGKQAFRGSYRWTAKSKVQDWKGQKLSSSVPNLRNFTRQAKNLRPVSNNRKVCDGTYKSSFGTIRLATKDNLLLGDYGSKGVLIGMWDSNHYAGHFSNNGRLGWFRFYFASAQGQFQRGEWGWFGSDKTGAWNMTKTNSATPRLTQIALRSNSKTGSVKAEQRTPPPTPPRSQSNKNQNPPPQTNSVPKKKPVNLFPITGFERRIADTMVGQQQHVGWISKGTTKQALDFLQEYGFTVPGNRIITSEATGPLVSKLTTERLRSYVAYRGNDVVICFRGTHDDNFLRKLGNIGSDVNFLRKRAQFMFPSSSGWNEGQNVKMHSGLHNSYMRMRPQVMNSLGQIPDKKKKNVYFFGHSMGAAQATLCALDTGVNMKGQFKSLNLLVSGSPRVGDVGFARFFEKHVKNAMRIEVKHDIITMIPPSLKARGDSRFIHIGKLAQLKGNGVLVPGRNTAKTPRGAKMDPYHKNTHYKSLVKNFWTQAVRAKFFDNLSNYWTEAARTERN